MGELIDRQAAIDASCTCHGGAHCNHYPCKDVQAIMDLPTIEERKEGKWINDRLVSTNGGTYGVRRCSECEAYYQDVGYGWNYCPNCGADMRGEQDG